VNDNNKGESGIPDCEAPVGVIETREMFSADSVLTIGDLPIPQSGRGLVFDYPNGR
jgi:hypothetical protein